jgi:hypothetical protein
MLGLDLADFIENHQERRLSPLIESAALDNGIIVPNPNTGKMSYIYTMESDQNYELQIYNSRGRLIQSQKLKHTSNAVEVDLSH